MKLRTLPTAQHKVTLNSPTRLISRFSQLTTRYKIYVIGRTIQAAWKLLTSCLSWILSVVGEPGPALSMREFVKTEVSQEAQVAMNMDFNVNPTWEACSLIEVPISPESVEWQEWFRWTQLA
jgi:hypothetical protein